MHVELSGLLHAIQDLIGQAADVVGEGHGSVSGYQLISSRIA